MDKKTYLKKWIAEHKEHLKKYQTAYRKANPQKIKEIKKRYEQKRKLKRKIARQDKKNNEYF